MILSLVFTAVLALAGTSYGVPAPVHHVAEVYFVVEPQVVRNYMKLGYSKSAAISTIRGDIKYFLYEVNELYKSMQNYNIYIEVRQKALKIMDTSDDMFESCKLIRGTDLQSDIALEVFKEWLKKTNAKASIGFDIALVWTGFDLFGSAGNNQVTGYATTKAACNQDIAVAAVEFDATYSTALTTAHEIGHSLGSPHDTGSCNPHDGYIMTPIGSVTNVHRWQFSSCSIQSIVNYINTLNKQNNNCLMKTTTPPSTFKLSSQANRDILNVEKICQRAKKDKNSYFCSYPSLYNTVEVKGDAVCKKLMCATKGTGSCLQVFPSEGMVCDANKRCHQGRCVAATFSTPGVSAHCVFGDIQSNFINNEKMSCNQFILKKGADYCYQSSFRATCCGTCNKRDTHIYGCEFGDRNVHCHDNPATRVCHGVNNLKVCCETCHDYTGKRSLYTNETLVTLPVRSVPDVVFDVTEEVDPKLIEVPVAMD